MTYTRPDQHDLNAWESWAAYEADRLPDYVQSFAGATVGALKAALAEIDRLNALVPADPSPDKRWFVSVPGDGTWAFEAEHEAIALAADSIDRFLDDTWDEDVEGIVVGYITARTMAVDTIERTDPRWDEVTGGREDIGRWTNYEVRRFGDDGN